MVCIFQQEIKIGLEVYQLSGTGGIRTFFPSSCCRIFWRSGGCNQPHSPALPGSSCPSLSASLRSASAWYRPGPRCAILCRVRLIRFPVCCPTRFRKQGCGIGKSSCADSCCRPGQKRRVVKNHLRYVWRKNVTEPVSGTASLVRE